VKHIIAVTNQKGGVGKTTTTVNVAAQLAGPKRRVVIVDLDPQGNAKAEVDLVSVANRETRLREALSAVDAEVVMIDCPPALGLLTINALTAATDVLIPVQAEYFALEGLGQLLQTIQAVKQGLNPRLDILGVVLTMYNKRISLSEQVQTELKQHFEDKLFKTVVPRNVRLAEAPSFGRTIFEHDKWSKGARAYKSLAAEIAKRLD
jgi:chromosome partitioning protein